MSPVALANNSSISGKEDLGGINCCWPVVLGSLGVD